jgi:hypothetical protein
MKFKPMETVTIVMASIIFIFVGYNLYFDIRVKSIMNSKDIKVIGKEADSNITIDIKKGSKYVTAEGILAKHIITPEIAIWVENMDGKFIKTIYVTPKQKGIKRSSSLPVWSRIEGIEDDTKSSIIPKGSITINTIKPDLDKFNILLEVNKIYDANKYYNIGEKHNGQPSLIYLVTIDNQTKTYKMELFGHGSSTGVDGIIYKDVSGITTAKDILKEVNITVK